MTRSRSVLSLVCAAVLAITVVPPSQGAAVKTSGQTEAAGTPWSIQVEQVDPGTLQLPYSFQIAIYENLLDELRKTNQFQRVFREGEYNASEAPHLLVLKTTVEKYSPGSETRRAVTTVSGATRLTVRSQLFTREDRLVLERTIDGDVFFFGSNLRATHNLACNIAKSLKEAPLSESSESVAAK